MSLILSIDTSTPVCSVALTKQGQRLDAIKVEDERSHANLLTLKIKELLDRQGIAFEELSAIGISEGPGSYTGLRIGVSTAKALCFTLKIPLIAVSTLKAMALELKTVDSNSGYYVPMIDARRMEVYTAVYDNQLNEVLPVQAKILDGNSFSETLSDHSVLIGGDGAEKFKPLIKGNSQIRFVNGMSPSAWAVGLLAYEKLEKGEKVDVAYFEPFYLKEYRATKAKPLL